MSLSIYDIPLRRIDGKSTTLREYEGKALLLVNVASKCGLTPQYEGLEKLYEMYRAQGLEVLGFPANEFMGQEPGTNEEIQEFCRGTFGVQFPLFEKLVVKGEGQHPLYKLLTQAMPVAQNSGAGDLETRLESKGLGRKNPQDVLWNFEKFLVDRSGKVVDRFAPDMDPADPSLEKSIEKALKARI